MRPVSIVFVAILTVACTRRESLDTPTAVACPAATIPGVDSHEARVDPNRLTLWIDDTERSELHALGVSIRRDRDAVLAAITFPWSNGQVEGQVNRLKLLKRMMYGRANF